MDPASEKCIAFTTFRKSGTPVTSPVWLVPLDDGRIGFYTSMGSGKTKRLRNNPAVTVQPCDMRGRLTPGTSPVSGTAEVVRSGPLYDEVMNKIRKKYGWMARVAKVTGSLALKRQGLKYADSAVLVRLDE